MRGTASLPLISSKGTSSQCYLDLLPWESSRSEEEIGSQRGEIIDIRIERGRDGRRREKEANQTEENCWPSLAVCLTLGPSPLPPTNGETQTDKEFIL